MTFKPLSPEFCSHNGTIVLEANDKTVVIGMINIDDAVLRTRILKAYPDLSIQFETISPEAFSLKLSRLFSEDESSEGILSGGITNQASTTGFTIDQIENDAPLINLLNSIFLEAISRHASDIHIESEPDDTQIRFRIDGILIPVLRITSEKSSAVSARLKLLADLNVLENRRPQDGRIDIISGGFSLDVRISITPTVHGESIVLRLLNRADKPLSLKDLGFNPAHLAALHDILELSSGLVLVTGPTGSGKTTTLAAVLRELNSSEIKIISIEDPVEYRIKGITQIQTNEELGLTFDTYLRRIFRQDPDIIMIGEIRDVQTAELAVRAAMTGHLVFATLHTNNALDAIARMENMDIPPYLIASVLRAVIGQRLVRRTCSSCRGKGCNLCSDTGYLGRIVVAEIIPVDAALADKISDGVRTSELEEMVTDKKILFMKDDAKKKALEGITTGAEVKRELGGMA